MQEGKQNTNMEIHPVKMDSIFLLRRIINSSNGPSVQVDFSPIVNFEAQNNDTSKMFHQAQIYPVFNHDQNYFTPAFILGADKEKCIKNSSSYLMLHERKKQQMTEQKTELLVAKPSKGNSFCCICKTVFEDYLTHVNIPKHQEVMRSSAFCEYIIDLCKIFNKQQIEEIETKKSKRKSKKVKKSQKSKKSCNKMINCLSSTTIQTENVFQTRMKVECS